MPPKQGAITSRRFIKSKTKFYYNLNYNRNANGEINGWAGVLVGRTAVLYRSWISRWISHIRIEIFIVKISLSAPTHPKVGFPVLVMRLFVLNGSLLWRNNGRDCVSNHQLRDCIRSHSFRDRSKKTSKLRVTGLCAENSPMTGEFLAQMTSNAEKISIWWRRHVLYTSVLPAIIVAIVVGVDVGKKGIDDCSVVSKEIERWTFVLIIMENSMVFYSICYLILHELALITP